MNLDYQEKLRLAKEALDSGSYDKETIEYIFPELKESEDERIRKQLLNWFKDCSWDSIDDGNLKREDIVAWLEKQGKPTYNKGLSELLHKVICRYINDPNISYSEREIVSIKVLPYVELLEKKGKQGPVNKIEPIFNIGDTIVEKDDDECDYETIKDIKNGRYIFTDGYCMNIDDQEGWKLVKTPAIIEQKPAWSEEDEKLLNLSFENLTELKDRFGETYGKVGDCIHWLKSLKERYTWKPSVEQMDALENAIRYGEEESIGILSLLYNDLKKLMEE